MFYHRDFMAFVLAVRRNIVGPQNVASKKEAASSSSIWLSCLTDSALAGSHNEVVSKN